VPITDAPVISPRLRDKLSRPAITPAAPVDYLS
jgi:hypothetical protein